MVNIVFGDNNYLGFDFEREFKFKRRTFQTIRQAINEGVCKNKRDFMNLLRSRCLQHNDFIRYLLLLDGKITYRSLRHTYYIPLQDEMVSIDFVEDVYSMLNREMYLAGCKQRTEFEGRIHFIVKEPLLDEIGKGQGIPGIYNINKRSVIVLHTFLEASLTSRRIQPMSFPYQEEMYL